MEYTTKGIYSRVIHGKAHRDQQHHGEAKIKAKGKWVFWSH